MSSLTWSIDATVSTSQTFSDKLMMFHISILTTLGIGYYGIGLGTSMRQDIATHYTRLIGETLKYSSDGADIMIKNGWLEEPPHAANRDFLANI